MSQGKVCQFTLVKKLNEAPTLGEEHLALINGLSFHGPAIVQRDSPVPCLGGANVPIHNMLENTSQDWGTGFHLYIGETKSRRSSGK